jgi:hypothetical protein
MCSEFGFKFAALQTFFKANLSQQSLFFLYMGQPEVSSDPCEVQENQKTLADFVGILVYPTFGALVSKGWSHKLINLCFFHQRSSPVTLLHTLKCVCI